MNQEATWEYTELKKKFEYTRYFTEYLVRNILPEDSSIQAAPFVSPPKWHLAHSTWFFEEFILSGKAGYTRYNEKYAFLFNSYYNGIGDRIPRSERGLQSRPPLQDIMNYRTAVTESILELIERGKLDGDDESILELGIHHEQQHQELLITDIKYLFGSQYLKPAIDFGLDREEHKPETESGFVALRGGQYSIGYRGHGFFFDNERPVHDVYISDFRISQGLVNNAQYLEFMDEGAYRNPLLWFDDGWSWLLRNTINSPLYWENNNGEWHHYTLNGMQPLNPQAPVTHISYYEASAFALWAGYRLPTEFEWELASEQFSWGERWEWTGSSYEAYPGYKPRQDSIGEYNGKFMVNQRVLRGAAFCTSRGHSRKTYRNFFHPEQRWQYTGLRMTESI